MTRAMDEKNARLEMTLKAKSGCRGGSAADVSAAQWSAVNAIVDGVVSPQMCLAAQDLYDALQRLLRFVAEHTASGEVVPAHTVEHVRTYAALAKARGEA